MKISHQPAYLSEKIELKQKLKLNVSSAFQNTINYLHAKIKGLEWSGALFYEVKNGSLLSFNPDDLTSLAGIEIDLKHFELSDIGSAAYTEYDITQESLFNMYDKNTELTEWELGFLHSHHSMATNPSGTDIMHLRDSTETNQWFLSVIVNHDMKWKALLATRRTLTVPAHKLPVHTIGYDGKPIKYSRIVQESSNITVFEMELDIVFEEPKDLAELVGKIAAQKIEKAKLLPKFNHISGANWENPAYVNNTRFGEPNIRKSGKQTLIFKDEVNVEVTQKICSEFISVLLDTDLKEKAKVNQELRNLSKLDIVAQEEEIELAFDCMPDFFFNLTRENLERSASKVQSHCYDLLPPPFCTSLSKVIVDVYKRVALEFICDGEIYNDVPDFKL